MKINEHVTKSFTFSCEDAQLMHSVILEQFGRKTIKSALDWPDWYLPLFSGFGKIAGSIRMMDFGQIQFLPQEKASLCQTLQKALDSETDPIRKGKLQALLEGISENA